MNGAILLLSLTPLSLRQGYEAGVLAALTLISIAKLKELAEYVSEKGGSHDLFYSFSCD